MPMATERRTSERSDGADREALVRLAYRFCWNMADAEDAVQNASLIAEQKRKQVRDSKKWQSWLKSIVVRQCLELKRKAKREQKATATLRLRLPEESREESFAPSELGGVLRTLIQDLPERQQTVLVLRHLENMPYDEIARLLDITKSTVRVQVRNAREALRTAMLEQYPEWTG